MCDPESGPSDGHSTSCDHPTRRQFLALTTNAALATAGVSAVAALAGGIVVGRATRLGATPASIEVASGLRIHPRAAWGADLPVRGPIAAEEPRFLLVHHTASPNTPPAGGTRSTLRSIYGFHTGPERRWPDVCYQFFVDRDGEIWEGRAGSLEGPTIADATGGSQGWAQLVCLIGDFTSVAPTPAARAATVALLAWLAERYRIPTEPGATAEFTSRGSNRWPAGTSVSTPTIAGHRDMTFTSCPGDAFYPDIRSRLATDVHAWRLGHPLPVPPPDPDGLQPAQREGRRTPSDD